MPARDKVYISGALMGSSNLERARALYEDLASACRIADCNPYLPHANTDPEKAANLSNRAIATRDSAELHCADVLLAYLGEPSLGVGAEIVLAMSDGKPILAVWERGKRVSRFVLGLLEDYDRARLHAFNSREELRAWVRDALVSRRTEALRS